MDPTKLKQGVALRSSSASGKSTGAQGGSAGAGGLPFSEPDFLAESTPTGGWCQLKKASGFTENLPNFYQIFTDFQSFPQISDDFD